MNRVIKFRVWSQETGTYKLTQDGMMEMPVAGYVSPGRIELNGDGEVYDIYNKEDLLTIEQFTGLTDHNGRDIYEGDIVLQHGNRDIQGWRFLVGQIDTFIPLTPIDCNSKPWKMEMPLGGFGRLNRWTGNNEPFYEVIGNIHENKDLL
jgi:hypothetical protein